MLALIQGGRAGYVGDAGEAVAGVVVEKLGLTPFDQEKVFVAVVVVVAPDRTHRDAGSRPIYVPDAERPGDILEGAVVLVTVEAVLRALGAVGGVEVGPAVAVEVDDGDGRAHGGDLRHNGVEFRVELRRLMDEVDARDVGDLLKVEAVASERGGGVEFCCCHCVFSRGKSPDDNGRGQHPGKQDGQNDADNGGSLHGPGLPRSAFVNGAGVMYRVWYFCQSSVWCW